MFNIFKKKSVKLCGDCKHAVYNNKLDRLFCEEPNLIKNLGRDVVTCVTARLTVPHPDNCGERAIYFEAKNEGTA